MIFRLSAIALALAAAGPALAGDAAKGEADFPKKCKSCHTIIAADGTEIVKGGKTGPNLFGIIGKPVASSDFKYGDGILAAQAAGAVWDEAALAAYVADPGGWLKEVTGDGKAKTKMTFKLPKGNDDMAAYLATLQ